MNKVLAAVAILVLLPVTANAIQCYQVHGTFEPNAAVVNEANIVRSGWGKFSLFSPPVPALGWFKFDDNKRAFAVANGTVSPTQWSVDMQTVTSASDCSPTIPAPLNPNNQNNFVAYASVEILFCIGWNATHHLAWDGQLTYPGDYFEVKYKNQFFQWVPFYTGTGGSTTFTTKESSARFKVRVNSVLVAPTAYTEFWTYENCMGPPNPL